MLEKTKGSVAEKTNSPGTVPRTTTKGLSPPLLFSSSSLSSSMHSPFSLSLCILYSISCPPGSLLSLCTAVRWRGLSPNATSGQTTTTFLQLAWAIDTAHQAMTPSSPARSTGPFTFQRSALAKDYYYVEGDSDGDEEGTAPSAVRPGEPDAAATRVAPSSRRPRRARPANIPMRRCYLLECKPILGSNWNGV